MLLDKGLLYLGRTLIGAGILVFLFIGYQLYGTSVAESRAQDDLQNEAEALFAAPAPTAAPKPAPTTPPRPGQTAAPTTAATTPRPAPAPEVPRGSAVAVMRIPKINLTKAVVSGTDVNDLKKGPGHYEGTPLPGQSGNSAIAGHRTTYGSPFGRLDELQTGDEINVTTRQGTFVYRVTTKRVVAPHQNSVLAPTRDNRLTLTTCHPRFSAAQRLIVTAELAPGATPAPPPAGTAPSTLPPPTVAKPGNTTLETTTTTIPVTEQLDGAGLSGQEVAKYPALLWGFITLIVGIAIYVLSRVWNRLFAYIAGAPVFIVALIVFFESLNRLLPANA